MSLCPEPIYRALEAIAASQGYVAFDDYMAAALYTKDVGYYCRGQSPIGAEGDFVTAPAISPFLADCLSRHVLTQAEQRNASVSVLECGPGRGDLAAQLLSGEAASVIKDYHLIEISPALQSTQKARLDKLSTPPCYWHAPGKLPALSHAVVIANELWDAFPVKRFRWTGSTFEEQFVRLEAQQCHPYWDTPTPELATFLTNHGPTDLPTGYESECCLSYDTWFHDLSKALDTVYLIGLDYGFLAHEFYHADRREGTLAAHHQHRVHFDPWVHIGEQDLTAHVNFTDLIRAAEAHGFTVRDYQDQANFLLNSGLLSAFEEGVPITPAVSQQLQTLLSPSEMGALFKVVVLEKTSEHSPLHPPVDR